ncbi:hypothetical protein A3I27_04875 [Candidatus Giovannonibacteria bacterium RIFCSPLOWO2_02_FULL_43_11b]|uniref:Uncharacterized protein n=1 Tax=Candidatus Giovannonibacteria bacterium RIFCSPHIGHO2_12_FULL_43_15 TaxID=1798341 RepID=A0A1F5WNG5_9BACT|nr:MAG: hypothetical protein A3B97_02980 [Candidatus Giovannonibacteria bacterium RIFCSPHIGHO2_02_FULL_43_32]OGF77196.1 MAG: hypothetical protein A3F23_01730 [Candidatus Giovannonibacteria bacterium RIFCSPHIGHO2_12_FULL_43_15]OGF78662.1 MAG: hypothetical protein A3A15_02640 [Candidatus Giovannonibacteria bacterium RIFCSPLOWO2_01_FULL_43_60]OGF90679.1 MAG: hypothetical protein A3I27_04875 [Candidatus Giovannonibacteria bacterium RIFCSPLOWO2_02_FULL_43_11b]OGF91528.1 MAG: hypothetical protein A3H
MGIFEKLQEIREKPVAARKKLLFTWMAISMTIVIVLWIGILKFDESENKASDNGPSPFEVLKKGFNQLTN